MPAKLFTDEELTAMNHDELRAAYAQMRQAHVNPQKKQSIDMKTIAPHVMLNPGAASLSPREFEVVIAIACGLTNSQIAEMAACSVKTIDTHRMHACKKIKARNNADITRWAFQHDLVTHEGTAK